MEPFWCLKRVIDAIDLSRHFIGNSFCKPDDTS